MTCQGIGCGADTVAAMGHEGPQYFPAQVMSFQEGNDRRRRSLAPDRETQEYLIIGYDVGDQRGQWRLVTTAMFVCSLRDMLFIIGRIRARWSDFKQIGGQGAMQGFGDDPGVSRAGEIGDKGLAALDACSAAILAQAAAPANASTAGAPSSMRRDRSDRSPIMASTAPRRPKRPVRRAEDDRPLQ